MTRGKRKALISRKSFSYLMSTFFDIFSCKFVQKKSKCYRCGQIALRAIKLPCEINDLFSLEIRRWKTGLVGNCTLDSKCTRLYMKFPLKTWLDCWTKCNFLGFSMILLVNMLFALSIFYGICKGNTLSLANECVSGNFVGMRVGSIHEHATEVSSKTWEVN